MASFGLGSTPMLSSQLTSVLLAVDSDKDLDPNIRLVVKKLGKRDSITKAKALEELLAMLSADPSAMESGPLVRSYWEALFCRLACDIDRKVRENTLSLHYLIVKTNSKLLAPFLKSILGTWIACRFDVSKEVAVLAQDSFALAFPNKLEQVLVFGQAEFIKFVYNTALEQTVQSMSDAR
ncbi:listerin E3 ubiquitin protein ligase 1 [Kappamyces sp. JEL0680]|nr:listerin E3 ubiquitin protein ligase 1 [Kappamyces sp. JEL0680]